MKAAASALLLVLLAGCDTGGEDASRSTDTTVVPPTPVTDDRDAVGASTVPAEDAYGTASGTGTGTAGTTGATRAAEEARASGTRAQGGGTRGEAGSDAGTGTIDATGDSTDDGAGADRVQDPGVQEDKPADSAPTPAQPPARP